MASGGTDDATYILPVRWEHTDEPGELTAYLRELSRWLPVIVVGGSPAPVFDRHHALWCRHVRHVRAPERAAGQNGKVIGVVAGARAATTPLLVIADDDVRYTRPALERLVALLREADVLRPQNHYLRLPWHARWDTARILVNRAGGADYPGTLGVRRSMLLPGGYDAGVLFENLELMRTVRARGGRVVTVRDLHIGRMPPTWRHFRDQRVRQAYDSLAQPPRLLAELLILPSVLWAARRPRRLLGMAGAAVLLAACGRRGGETVFPRSSALLAPGWMLERGVCSWLALRLRARGGVPYAGSTLIHAARGMRRLRHRERESGRVWGHR